jgi:hypothetical protein
MSAPADAHCGSMPCHIGLLLNAIDPLSGSTTLLPGQRTRPAAGAGAKGSLRVHLGPARPGLCTTVLGDRHNTHHERNPP